jgi:Arc/MetJ family transcription regulator
MARTNIDIEQTACAVVMRGYHLSSKRAAVNFAFRSLAAEPMDIDDARALRGRATSTTCDTTVTGPSWERACRSSGSPRHYTSLLRPAGGGSCGPSVGLKLVSASSVDFGRRRGPAPPQQPA